MDLQATITDPGALGALIKAARKQQGMTQQELAALTGFSLAFVNHVENGKPTAQLGKTLALLRQLGIKLYARTPGPVP